ncbi:MAG: hypothetical protein QXO86_07400 [Nitrososphaerota archaeon]
MQESQSGRALQLRDHDYFETLEGWIFFVLGDIHPDGRVWSCLKYVPGDGVWGSYDRRLVRVIQQYTVSELLRIIRFLEENQPGYVFHDPTVDAKVIAPPINRIARTYSAKQRLSELLQSHPSNRLERQLVSLVKLLSESSGVPLSYFGVTGSILPGIHHQNSDIDLVVYGLENTWRVVDTLLELEREGKITLMRKLDPYGWARRAATRYSVPHESLLNLASKVVNKGSFDGVAFSIHSVRERPMHRYGEIRYVSLGMATARLRVVDVKESLATPAVYYVEDVNSDVERVVCYDMMLAGVLREGDLVEVHGKLESAMHDSRESWRQILIGSYEGVGKEYIKVVG